MARTKYASPTMEVTITDAEREHAIQSASGGCLIADAIRRKYPNLTGVTVDMATVRVSDKERGLRFTYLTPRSAQFLLLSYDQGWPNPTEGLIIRRAVHVTPIKRSLKETSARHERLVELEEKEKDGTLTPAEKSGLTRLRRHPDRPSAHGKPSVRVGSNTAGAVVAGGAAPAQGHPHPNLLRGRDRHFGAKLADPGEAFKNAVEAAVAERLAMENADA
jgi:hypothetical protein